MTVKSGATNRVKHLPKKQRVSLCFLQDVLDPANFYEGEWRTVVWSPSDRNLSDIHTKALARAAFQLHRQAMRF